MYYLTVLGFECVVFLGLAFLRAEIQHGFIFKL